MTTVEPEIVLDCDRATIEELASLNDSTLENVYPTVAKAKETEALYAQRLEKAEQEIADMRREAIAKDEERARVRLEETEAKAAHILEDAREKAQRQSSKILEEAQQQVSDMAVAAVKKLMQESLSESYDEFLNAAERSVADEQN